jgi:hypothetical protein
MPLMAISHELRHGHDQQAELTERLDDLGAMLAMLSSSILGNRVAASLLAWHRRNFVACRQQSSSQYTSASNVDHPDTLGPSTRDRFERQATMRTTVGPPLEGLCIESVERGNSPSVRVPGSPARRQSR